MPLRSPTPSPFASPRAEAKADSSGQLRLGSGAQQIVLTVSPTGLVQKIEMPDERFSVTFYNVKIEQES